MFNLFKTDFIFPNDTIVSNSIQTNCVESLVCITSGARPV